MEKEKYVIPQAIVEEFVPNSYIAKCGLSVSKNGMRCINPKHDHFYSNGYFASVWISDGGNACSIKVDERNLNKSSNTDDDKMIITKRDFCLFADGHEEQATKEYTYNGRRTYVPVSYYLSGPEGCYGSYCYDGSAVDTVLS